MAERSAAGLLLKLFRAFAAHGTGKLVGGGADQRPELLEPLFGRRTAGRKRKYQQSPRHIH